MAHFECVHGYYEIEIGFSKSGYFFRLSSSSDEHVDALLGLNEVTFHVSQTKFGRRGWKVMPAEDGVNLAALSSCGAVEQVMTQIRNFEYSGRCVPEKITIMLK